MIDIEDGVVEDMLSRGSSLSELPSQEREGASADGAA